MGTDQFRLPQAKNCCCPQRPPFRSTAAVSKLSPFLGRGLLISARIRRPRLEGHARLRTIICYAEFAAMIDTLGLVLMIIGAGLVFSHLDVILGSSSND